MENLGEILYNPIDPFFKSVVGAVEEGQEVTFNILVAKSLGASKVAIKIYSDNLYMIDVNFMQQSYHNESHDKYSFTTKLDKGLYWYYFILEGVKTEPYVGISQDCRPQFFYADVVAWQLNVYKREYPVVKNLNKGAMYHVFVDRFCSVGQVEPTFDKYMVPWGEKPHYQDPDGKYRCRDFFGGNIKGITSKLDYIKSLGVTILYLSPIFKAYSNNKYDTANYEEIDEMFGTKEDFDQLIQKAEELGIFVVLDGVFNHTGSHSVYFNKDQAYGQGGAYNDRNGPYADWYFFYKDGVHYESWWGFENLPRLNAFSHSLQNYLCGENGIVDRWTKSGIGGWRLDVVDEIADEMLDKIVSATKKANPNSIVIGEVWEDASNKSDYGIRRRYFEGAQLDSVMNYPFMRAVVQFLTTNDASELKKVVFQQQNNYPYWAKNNLMNILGSHDTRRILNQLTGMTCPENRDEQSQVVLNGSALKKAKQLLKLAIVLQYTYTGFPSIFYGDEAGMQGEKDPFCRGCFPWGQEDQTLTHYYQKLGKIRLANSVFADGDLTLIPSPGRAIAYRRTLGKQNVIVAVSKEDYYMQLDGVYKDLLTGKKHQSICKISGAMILKKVS
ncbi:MAG: glycoside hydrolase family 13 protein [Clostridia bacterium]|nr:glycoside hydrolase family 13 protein [Clostridia bacterium]